MSFSAPSDETQVDPELGHPEPAAPSDKEKAVAQDEPLADKPLAFGPNDPDDPRLWPNRKRYLTVAIVCVMTLSVTYTSSAYALSVPSITAAFGVSREVAILGVSVFVIGFAVGPLVFGPSSDIVGVGRNPIYKATFVCYTAFCLGAAFAPNIGAMITFRFLAGLFGSSAINNAPASIADVTTLAQRGPTMLFYAISAFGGPSLGPICGGFIASYAPTWRWNLHVCSIFVGVATVLACVGLDETHHPTIISRRNAKQSGVTVPRKSAREVLRIFRIAVARPAQILFTEPIAALVSLYLSILYGCVYGFFALFPVVYEEIRGFPVWSYGLTYVSLLLGFLSAFVVVGVGHRKVYLRKLSQSPNGRVRPELLIWQAFWAGPLAAASLFLFAWTGPFRSVHWFVPCLAEFIYGMCMQVLFTGLIPYLIECYAAYAASALAVGMFTRAAFGSAFPLFMIQMADRLTVQGAVSLLAGILCLCAPLPFILWRMGPALRERSKFAQGG